MFIKFSCSVSITLNITAMVQGTSGKGRQTDREAVTVWRLMDTTER